MDVNPASEVLLFIEPCPRFVGVRCEGRRSFWDIFGFTRSSLSRKRVWNEWIFLEVREDFYEGRGSLSLSLSLFVSLSVRVGTCLKLVSREWIKVICQRASMVLPIRNLGALDSFPFYVHRGKHHLCGVLYNLSTLSWHLQSLAIELEPQFHFPNYGTLYAYVCRIKDKKCLIINCRVLSSGN